MFVIKSAVLDISHGKDIDVLLLRQGVAVLVEGVCWAVRQAEVDPTDHLGGLG